MQVKCDFGLSETQKDWVTASVFLGMMVGAQAWGALSDAQGRKIGFLVPAVITALAGFASAGAQNYAVRLQPVVGLRGSCLGTRFMQFNVKHYYSCVFPHL